MAHFALSDIGAKKFTFRERIKRGYGDTAGAATDRFRVWNEDWKVEGDEKHHVIHVNDRGTQLRLGLRSLKAPVLHGQNGLSQKGEGEGRASYYYSLTRMQTEGELTDRRQKRKSPRPHLDGPRVRQQSAARRSSRLGLVQHSARQSKRTDALSDAPKRRIDGPIFQRDAGECRRGDDDLASKIIVSRF